QLDRCTDRRRKDLATRFQLLDEAHEPQDVVALVDKVHNFVAPTERLRREFTRIFAPITLPGARL
ncbi:hypothetical protein, partial [Longimicrobium sp.]|uniref:hypothetical protein n=1 Tax=Longimicrobium sp. TaxID=2029185 RepID=UPI002C097873